MREKTKSGRRGSVLESVEMTREGPQVGGGGITRTARKPLFVAEPGVLPTLTPVCWAGAEAQASTKTKSGTAILRVIGHSLPEGRKPQPPLYFTLTLRQKIWFFGSGVR